MSAISILIQSPPNFTFKFYNKMKLNQMDLTLNAIKKSSKIDQEIYRAKIEFESLKSIPKLLILGTGDSGKTTFLKQLSILDGQGFTPLEKTNFRNQIIIQIIQSIHIIAQICQDLNLLNSMDIDFLRNMDTLNQSNLNGLERILNTNCLNPAFLIGYRYEMVTHGEYLIRNAGHYVQDNYELSNEDILKVRVSTSSITEKKFNLHEGIIVYDVGGQRGLRKQWMPYFDEVHAIVFVTDISSFDQTLEEDTTVNRMKDALLLFINIINAPLLKHISIVLFLNKVDLLETKLEFTTFQHYFPAFQGEQNIETVSKFIRNQFLSKSKRTRSDGHIIPHITCCTDTKSIKVIVDTVLSGVLKSTLRNIGFV
ncbi:G-protein alpha subunit-domain-containing protein [Globomyces pollinis-pini]|nr:G-protein alpha subunit-domain-containing protein [Globomyces pollinis-pini]